MLMDRLRTSLCDLLKQQNREYFPMYAGQSVGMVHDLPGAAEIVETLVREARAALRALGERVQLG
jgi:hypothetical protein